MRIWVLAALVLCGCGPDDMRMGWSTYAYRPGGAEWSPKSPVLTRPRAAHSVVALGSESFLVLGGDSDTAPTPPNTPVKDLELNLDVERCVLGDAQCQVIARLPRGVELAQTARIPGGGVAIAGWDSMKLLDPTTGGVTETDLAVTQLVATAAGVAVLGIEGERNPTTNLPGPRTYGVIRGLDAGVEPIDALPDGVWLDAAAAVDDHRVLVASPDGSAILDVERGTWTAASPLPSDSYGPFLVGVGDGYALARAYGDSSAYLYSVADDSWTPVPAPSTGYVVQAVQVPDGAVFVVTLPAPATTSGQTLATQAFRLSDRTWLAGPGGPPWSTLNAMAALDDGLVISVGGADYDFIGARAAD